MSEVERLVDAFRAEGTGASVAWKLDVVLDLAREDNPQVVPFLLSVLADPRESTAVRLDVLKRVRNGRLKPLERPRVAETVPQPDRRVKPPAGHESTVVAERDAAHATGMALQSCQMPPAAGLPDADCAVLTAASNYVSI